MKYTATRYLLGVLLALCAGYSGRAQTFATVTYPSPLGPYCPGATFSVPFTLSAPFPTATTVYAELSDNSGNFSATMPNYVGSVALAAAATSGSVPVTIPTVPSISSGYMIQLRYGTGLGLLTSAPSSTFTINTKPSINNAALGSTICSGTATNIVLSASEASTFVWTATNGAGVTGATNGSGGTIAQTLTSSNNAAQTTATYSVVPTSTAGSCTGDAVVFTVTINPTPDVTTTPLNSTICSGTTTAIGLTASTPSTFTWTAVNGANVSGAAAGSGTTIGQTLTSSDNTAQTTAVYTITPTSIGGSCTGNAAVYTVTINPTPLVTNSPLNATICSGATTAIALTSSTPSTFAYTATNGTGVSGAANGSGASIAQTLTSSNNAAQTSATYSIIPTSTTGSCAGPAAAFTVFVNPTPVVTNSPLTAAVCSGGTTGIGLTSSTPSTFAWVATNNAGTSGATSGSGTGITQTLTNASNTTASTATYVVTPTSTAGSCPGPSSTFTVTVNPKPVVTNATLTSTICSGATTNIALTSSAPGTFNWVATNGASLSGATNGSGSSIMQTLTSSNNVAATTATYVVTPTATAGSCAGTAATFTVNVNPAPVITTTPLSYSICSGTAPGIALTASVASTFAWTVSSPSITGASAGSGASIAQTLTSTDNTAITTATYTVTPTATAGTCPGTPSNIIVNVNPRPVITNTPLNTTICSGSTTNIGLSASFNSTFTWTAVNGITVAGATSGSGNTIAQVLSNTSLAQGSATYTITPTSVSTPGCVGTASTYTVFVNAVPVASPVAATTVCSGTTINISLGANIPSTFSWTAANSSNTSGFSNGSGSLISQTLTNTTNTTIGTAIYNVTPTSTATVGCTGNPVSIYVNVNPAPAVTTVTPSAICSGGVTSIPLTASTAGTNTFSYVATNSFGISGGLNGTGASIAQTLTNSSNSVSGTTTYAVTPTSQQGCIGFATNIVQNVNPKPAVTSGGATSVCSGVVPAGFALTASTGAGSSFSWTVVNSSGITGSSAATGTSLAQTLSNSSSTTAGTATYTVTPTSGAGCSGTASTVVVTVNPAPVLTSATTASICNNGTTAIALTASTAGTSTFAYTATNGTNISGGTAGNTSGIAQMLSNSSNSTAGTVTYAVTPTSALGCPGAATNVIVTVNPTPQITNATTAVTCSGAALNIPLMASTPSTFTWTASNGTGTTGASAAGGPALNQTLVNASNVNTSTASYTITPTSNAAPGCVGSAQTINITVNPKPTLPSAPWNDSICSSGTIVYKGGSTGAGTKYTWTVSPVAGISGTTSQGIPNDSFVATLINTTATPIIVPYVITPISPAPASCAGNGFMLNLKVNPSGVISSGTTSYNICSGQPTNIPVSSVTAGAKFKWTVSAPSQVTGAAPDSATGNTAIAQTLTSSSNSSPFTVLYMVNSTTTGGCPNGNATYTVNVNPRPVLTTALTRDICSGTNTRIQLTSSTGAGASYTWTVGTSASVGGATGNAIYSTSIDSISQVLTSSNSVSTDSISYVVTTKSGAGCFSLPADVIKVRVAPAPVISTASNFTFCSNSATSIPLTSTANANYSWTIAGGSANPSIAGATPSTGNNISQTLVNPDTAASGFVTYAVVPVSTASTCTGPTKNITVTVRPLPTINFPSSFYAICSGQATSVALTPSVTPSTVAWTSGNSSLGDVTGNYADSLLYTSSGSQNLAQTLTNSTNTTSDTVTYVVRSISTSGGLRCPGTQKSIKVAVNPLPTLTSATSKSICSQTLINYTPTSSTGAGATFTWTLGANTGGILNATGNSNPLILLNDSLVNPRFDIPGSVVYNITPKSAQGCPATSSTAVTITVNPLPQLTSASTQSVCSESFFNYTPTSSVTSVRTTFQYERSSGVPDIPFMPLQSTIAIHDSLSSDHILIPQTVDYKFLLTTADGCSIGNQHVTVTVNPTPDTPGIALVPQTKLCQNAIGANYGARRSAHPGEVYAWSATNGAGILQLDSANRQYALVSFPQPGSTSILLKSKMAGANSCWTKDNVRTVTIDGGGGSANPNVVFFANNLVCQAAGVTKYQWGFDRKSDLDSTIIPGATNQNYPTTGTASQGYDPGANLYWVLATFTDGCVRKAYLNAPMLGAASVAASGSVAIRVYPNPATETVTVELPLTSPKDLHIAIYDIAGRILTSVDAGSNKVALPVVNLTPGCYMVVCTQGGARIAASRFIKQ